MLSPRILKNRSDGGFTLIELSVVLVVIGLIVGGILVGQDLIKSAQIQKLGTMIEQLNTAVNTFEGKYNCLPGDCANATTFFGTNPACAYSSTIPATTTCNGNGDGFIYSVDGDGFQNGGPENAYFFQQLILANLIADTRECTLNHYTCQFLYEIALWGLTTPFPSDLTNQPGAIAVVSLQRPGLTWGGPAIMQNTNHAYYLASTSFYETPALTPALLMQIDGKFDDGLPLSGIIQTLGMNGNEVGAGVKFGFNGTFDTGSGPGLCYNTSTSPNTYSLSTAITCPAMWRSAF